MPSVGTRRRLGARHLPRWVIPVLGAAMLATALAASQPVLARFVHRPSVGGNRFSSASCFSAEVSTVQSGTATNAINGTTTVNIASVDPTKAFLTFSIASNSNRPVGSQLRGSVATATTLSFVRVTNETAPSTINIRWNVVEYSCGVNVQRGEVAQTAATLNVPITPVSAIGRSFVTWSKSVASIDSEFGTNDPTVGELTTTTNVQFRVTTANPDHVISWQVVEFLSSTDAAVRTGATSMPVGTGSVNVTLPGAVDLSKTFALVAFRTAGACAPDVGSCAVRGRLTGVSTLTLDRVNTTVALTEVTWQVIQLKTGATVQAGSTGFAATAATSTATIEPIDTTRAIAFASSQAGAGQEGGRSAYAGDDILGVAQATVAITSPTQLTLTRGNTAAASDVGWFVVEFAAGCGRARSVQSGSAVSTANGTTTVTISSVNLAEAYLIFNVASNLNRPTGSQVRGKIATATSLAFDRVTNETSTITIEWSVVEYTCGIRVQRGEVALSATTINVAITPVAAIDQAYVTWSKTAAATDTIWSIDDSVVGELTSTSNLQFQVDGANAAHTIAWQVIEYISAADVAVQKGTTSMAVGTASVSITLPAAVDLSKTFALVAQRNSANCDNIGSCLIRAQLTGPTTLLIDRANSSVALTEVTWQVVELNEGSAVQAGSANFAAGISTVTVSLNSLAAGRAVAFASAQVAGGQSTGRSSYATDDRPGVAQATLSVTAPNELTLTRANTSAAADIGWFVVEHQSP